MSSWLMNPYRFAAPAVSPDEYTMLLAHFDGANGSTDFVDSAGRHILTANGDAQISTAQAKFGQSLLLSGTGYISTPDSDDWHFGAGDFTIECWVRRAETGVDHRIIGQYKIDNTDYAFESWIGTDNKVSFLYSTNGSSWNNMAGYTGTTIIAANAWTHIAFVRYGTTIKAYVNGTEDRIWSVGTASLHNSTGDLWIGASHYENGVFKFSGHIDELRVSKGIARWTENFTPPTTPY
jgi:hypothetical protein